MKADEARSLTWKNADNSPDARELRDVLANIEATARRGESSVDFHALRISTVAMLKSYGYTLPQLPTF